MNTKNLSRRDMLKLTGTIAAGSLLAACTAPTAQVIKETVEVPVEVEKTVKETVVVTEKETVKETVIVEPTPEPTEAPVVKPIEGNVVMMGRVKEFTEDEQKAFMDANPGITIELIPDDPTRLFAMLAAGAALDLYRCQAPVLPNYLARKLLLDLTPYFQVSDTLKVDDLAEVNKSYMANSALEIGSGKIYGMVKDWSPDMTLFVNDNIFDAAGVDRMDDTKVYTLAECYEIAKSVAKFTGDRVDIWGWGGDNWWMDRYLMVYLAEKGASLYKNSFTSVDESEDLKTLMNWYYTMSAEKLMTSSVNPSPNGWSGGDFTAGILAIQQFGFWFSPSAETDQTRGAVRILPAPTFSGAHTNPCVTATGYVIMANSQVPDAAWKVFEYYLGGQPAIDRAKGGWGFPGLKSLYSLLPQETPYQQQVLNVVKKEAEVAAPLQFNPFLGDSAFMGAWGKYWDEALTGVITPEEVLPKVAADVNALIQEGIARMG